MKAKYQLDKAKAVIIAILVLLLLAVAGYIVYDKLISQPSNNESSKADTSTETTATKVATKEVCAPYEKICFKYPAEGWEADVVESSYPKPPAAGEAYVKTDEMSIKSKSGEAGVYVNSGVMGIGSHCEAGTNGQVYIIRQQKTNLSGYSIENNQSADAYAVAMVHHTPEGKYAPRIGLTTDKDLIDKSEADGCKAAMFSLIEAKNIDYSSLFGDSQSRGHMSVSSHAFFDANEPLKQFDTLEEAKKLLNSEAYKQVFDIISSGYYK